MTCSIYHPRINVVRFIFNQFSRVNNFHIDNSPTFLSINNFLQFFLPHLFSLILSFLLFFIFTSSINPIPINIKLNVITMIIFFTTVLKFHLNISTLLQLPFKSYHKFKFHTSNHLSNVNNCYSFSFFLKKFHHKDL